MFTFIITMIVVIVWTGLSTIVFKIMTETMDIDFDKDPRVILATLFAPLGVLILIGYWIGKFLFKKFEEVFNKNND